MKASTHKILELTVSQCKKVPFQMSRHEMCNQQSLRSACAYAQSDQSHCWSLEYTMSVKLLTEHYLEFLSLKRGCTGSSESTLVKMPRCWKSHVVAQICLLIQCTCIKYPTYVTRSNEDPWHLYYHYGWRGLLQLSFIVFELVEDLNLK